MRLRRLTWQPCDSHRRRTSRLRPSLSSTRNQSWESVPPMRSISSNFAGPSSSATPRRRRSTRLSGTLSWPSGARTRQTYSRSTSNDGCIIALASSPSVVSSSRPVVLMSRRPIAIQRAPLSAGSASKMVGRPSGSSRVVTSPSGLLYIRTRDGSVSALATKLRPSISTLSPLPIDMPTCATSPLTLTRPSAMRCSSARREPRPACARTLCRRSSMRGVSAASPRFNESLRLPLSGVCCSLIRIAPGAVAVFGEGGVVRFVLRFVVVEGVGIDVDIDVVRREGFVIGIRWQVVVVGAAGDVADRHHAGGVVAVELELRLEFAEILQLRQRRQFVQPLQAEIVEEVLGGAKQFRAARDVAMADHADPLAFFQRLDDVAVDRDAAHLLDLAAGDRLAIGDQRQRFQRGAGVLGLALGPQPRDPGVDIFLHLVAEAGSEFDQLDAPVRAIGLQGFQRG